MIGFTWRWLGLGLILFALAARLWAAEEAERTAPILQLETGGHTAICRWLDFTPDGQSLVSVGDDKVIRVWDVRDPAAPRLDRSLRLPIGPGSEGKLYAGALSPDGRRLAVGGYPSAWGIRLLDLTTGRILAVLRGHTNVINGLAFSPDGRYLASSSQDKTVRVWDLASLNSPASDPKERDGNAKATDHGPPTTDIPSQVLEGHTDSVYDVAFVPGSQPLRLVSGAYDNTGRLWQQQADGTWRESAVLRGHEDRIFDVACSPDGRWIATSSRDRSVRLWQAEDGQFVQVLGTKSGDAGIPPRIAFAPDSRTLVVADRQHGGGAVVWSVPDGETVCRFDGHDNAVYRAAFAPDGKLVASTGGDAQDIFLWNPQTGEQVGHIVGRGSSVWAVAFSRDGRQIAYGQIGRGAELAAENPLSATFDLLTMEPGPEITDQAASGWLRGQLTADGYAAQRPDEVQNTLVITRAGREVSRITRPYSYDRINCYAFLPSRGQIVVGSNFTLTLHDVASGKQLRHFVGHTGVVWAVAASPDGRLLVSGSHDQTVRLWNLQQADPTVPPLLSLFLARDGQWVAWTEQGYYKASAEGDGLIGWHLNQGLDQPAQFMHAWQLRSVYHWPELIRLLPAAGSTAQAIAMWNRDPRNQRHQELDIQTAARRLLPPDVTIRAPAPYSEVTQRSVLLRANVTLPETVDQDQTVYARVMVNDRPVAGWDQRRLTLARPAAAQAAEAPAGERGVVVEPAASVIEADVPLTPGDNLLSVVAWTSLSTSDPVRVRVTCRAPVSSDASKPDLYLLPIGVSKHADQQVRPLRYADADARGVVQAFRQQEGRVFGKVHAYTVDPGDPDSLLVNERATRRNILQGIDWLRESVTDVDVAVVCVSGHGDRDALGSYFFIPHDYETGALSATAVRWSEFQDTLSRLPCRVLLVMDTCHSAGVTGRERSAVARSNEQQAWSDFIAEVTRVKSGLYVISAALPDQQAFEHDQWGHGALAMSIIEGLTSQRLYDGRQETPLPADANGNGIIELNELRTYVVRRVKELTGGAQHATALPSDLPPLPLSAP